MSFNRIPEVQSSEVKTISFSGLELAILPHPTLEWTMSTADVARGYGVSPEVIRSHKLRQEGELLENKHFIGVTNSNAAGSMTLWTKRGVIRLGMFIRSAQARAFRDMAEELVLERIEAPAPLSTTPLQLILQLAQSAVDLEQRLELTDARTLALEHRLDQSPITSEKVGVIHRAGQKLGQAMGNYRSAWKLFNDRFGLASYRDLPTHRFEEAERFLRIQYAAYSGTELLEFEAVN